MLNVNYNILLYISQADQLLTSSELDKRVLSVALKDWTKKRKAVSVS